MKQLKRHLSVAGVLAISLATPSLAQDYQETGSHLTRRPEKAVAKADLKGFAAFGACVAGRLPDMTHAVVLTNNGGKGVSSRDMTLITESNCVERISPDARVAMMSNESIRGWLADGLVQTELRGRMLPDLAAVAALDHPVIKPEPSRDPRQTERLQVRANIATFLDAFGECVVRADALGSRAMLDADPGTPAENSALRNMVPALGSCTKAGETISYTRELLRGPIAVNYYRLAQAAGLTSAPRK